MYRVLRKYKVGDGFKYVSIPLRDNNFSGCYGREKNNNKLLQNLIRARTRVKEYVLCNDFFFFFTLTCNDKKVNRYDLDKFRSFVTQRIRDFRKEWGLPLKYILIPEKHKKGGWHLHGVLDRSFAPFVEINYNGYDFLSIFADIGFNSIETIEDKNRISSYITKYITKDFAQREKGKHLYFSSNGLKSPELISQKIYDNDYFDNKFFDFYNDFCFLTYSKFNFNLDLK